MTDVTKPTSFLSEILPISSVTWSDQRNDELSGTGDGRIWQAELAPPLWAATVQLANMRTVDAKKIAAKVRSLQGSRHAFLLVDPSASGPALDPEGAALGSSIVSVAAIGSGRTSLALSGLPNGYTLSPGDKIEVVFEELKYAFVEMSEAVYAGAGGTTALAPVYPRLPSWVDVGMPVKLVNPACRVVIVPGGFDVGTTRLGGWTEGMMLTVVQKR